MPVNVSLDPEGRFVVLVVQDPYTFEQWEVALRGAMKDSMLASRQALLVDRRLAAPPTPATVRAMVAFFAQHEEFLRGRRCAIVADEDAAFGMSRMMELMSEFINPSITLRTFRDYAAAVAWLGDGSSGPGVAS